jgi:hypothetical protein
VRDDSIQRTNRTSGHCNGTAVTNTNRISCRATNKSRSALIVAARARAPEFITQS